MDQRGTKVNEMTYNGGRGVGRLYRREVGVDTFHLFVTLINTLLSASGVADPVLNTQDNWGYDSTKQMNMQIST